MLSIISNISFLLSPFSHSVAMRRMRANLIITRVQQIARLFVVLTLLWIVIDAHFLTSSLSGQLALQRIVTCVVFLLLGMIKIKPTLRRALLLLTGFYAVLLIFLLFAVYSMQESALTNVMPEYAMVYYFSPFALAAGIGFFPLTLLESLLLLVTPVMTTTAIYTQFLQTAQSSLMNYQILWVLVLSMMISVMSGMSQTGFLLELFNDTSYDKLSGLFLRRLGEVNLNQQIASAQRNHTSHAVLLVDIDNFKMINDRFGHACGDSVLGTIGLTLRSLLRQQDMAIRWGGDEILISLPNTTKLQAELFLKRLALHGLGSLPDGAPVTASFGIAEVTEIQAADFLALIDLADTRLYLAKNAGRNSYVSQNTATPWLNM